MTARSNAFEENGPTPAEVVSGESTPLVSHDRTLDPSITQALHRMSQAQLPLGRKASRPMKSDGQDGRTERAGDDSTEMEVDGSETVEGDEWDSLDPALGLRTVGTGGLIEGEERATQFVWILVLSAAISGLLFGYDTGVISGMLVVMKDDLGTVLTDWQKELVTSATTFGALLGGLAAGTMSDYKGRKPIITLSNFAFVLGALIQAWSHTVRMMVIGRWVVGVGVESASCIVPLYIGELSPTAIRGRLVTINNVAVTLGQVVAYIIGGLFQHAPGGWRWMVGLGIVPSLVQLVALTTLPESPRILLLRNQTSKVGEILSKIYPLDSEEQIEAKTCAMAIAVKQSVGVTETSWSDRLDRLFKVGTNRRALIIGCGLQASQQLCGFNTLMYYSTSVFSALGFRNPTVVGCLIASVNFAFTLMALRIVDPFGRRRTMLYTLPVMVGALLLSSLFFYELTKTTGGILVDGASYSSFYSLLLISSMLLYVSSYATGLGNIPWQQGELFQLDVRGLATSLCTATNWTCNMIIAASFLSLMRAATPAGAFGIYAAFCAASWVFCWKLYPETSGLSLEEVFHLFEHDFGVEKSEQIRRQKTAKQTSLS